MYLNRAEPQCQFTSYLTLLKSIAASTHITFLEKHYEMIEIVFIQDKCSNVGVCVGVCVVLPQDVLFIQRTGWTPLSELIALVAFLGSFIIGSGP